MEAEVRKIQCDGLLWGAGNLYNLKLIGYLYLSDFYNNNNFSPAKLVPVAFKIQKLQISCVVEDDKVSVDWLTEKIQEIEDFVQSVDIAAFNKV